MNKLKASTLLLLSIIMTFTLAACGGNSTTTSGSGTGTTAGSSAGTYSGSTGTASSNSNANTTKKPVEIEFWYAFGGKIEENNLELVRLFNESQDEVVVKASSQGDYNQLHAKVQAAFAAGNAPAVTLNEIASIGIFARSGMTEPLDPFIERDKVDMNDFIEGLMGNSFVEGKTYGLPYLRSTPILYMNVTKLKEAGLDPSGPKNWQEFEEYARKLTIKDKQVGMTMPVSDWYYEAYVAQGGGQMIAEDGKKAAFNSPAGIRPVELWLRMAKEGTLKIPTTEDAGALAQQDFQNQYSAMMFASTANLTQNIELAKAAGYELNVTFMPADKQFGVPTGGANLVMIRNQPEDKKEAAWKFIKWMTDTEQTVFASKFTGYLATRKSALETDLMKELYQTVPQYKVAMDQLEYARPRPMEDAYAEIRKIIIEEIGRAILTSATPEEVIAEAAKRADALLSK